MPDASGTAIRHPRRDQNARLCDDLERDLGPFGFQWLCACAVYPQLRFPLTVHLGRRLAEHQHRQMPAPAEDEHLALCRLPWFRSGWMPEELRLALLSRLDPGLVPVVRQAIESVLFAALDDDKHDAHAMPLEFQSPPAGWRTALRSWFDAAPPAAPARDAIFVHYMMGRVPTPADLWLDRTLTRLFGVRLAGWLDRRTLVWVTAALSACLILWSISDTTLEPLFSWTSSQTVLAPALVALPGGTFLMGSSEQEEGRFDNEGPQHEVTVKPFAIGKYEVTFAEWDACVAAGGCNDYQPADQGWGRERHPVINVSWQDAQAYVEWLAAATGKPFRLPTEAEWEFAARAGTTTRYAFGDEITPKEANYADSGLRKTAEVGSYPPNAWGLHDMHGNVWEWVEDLWHGNYEGAPTDGSAWTDADGKYSSRGRVGRGGSWNGNSWLLRSAFRDRYFPGGRNDVLGFRVARTLD